MQLKSLHSVVSLLAIILCFCRPLASCTGPLQLVDHLNNWFTKFGLEWSNNVTAKAKFVVSNGEQVKRFSFRQLPPVTAEDVDEKFLMTATLLGCQFMDFLEKHWILVRHQVTVCKNAMIERQKRFFAKCQLNVSANVVKALKMFRYAHSALLYLKNLRPDLHSSIDKFIDQVIGFIDLSKSEGNEKRFQRANGQVDINAVEGHMSKLIKYYVYTMPLFRHVIQQNCELSNNETFDQIKMAASNQYENEPLIGQRILDYTDNKIANHLIDFFGLYSLLGFKYTGKQNPARVPALEY